MLMNTGSGYNPVLHAGYLNTVHDAVLIHIDVQCHTRWCEKRARYQSSLSLDNITEVLQRFNPLTHEGLRCSWLCVPFPSGRSPVRIPAWVLFFIFGAI